MKALFTPSSSGLPQRRPVVAGLLSTLVTAEQYDFWARELGTTAAWRRVFARVCGLRREADDTVSLVLQGNRNFVPATAGQHVTLSLEINGRRHSRSYSLSRPAQGRKITLTVRREPEGLMSNYLHDQLRLGDVVELSQPFGDLGQSLRADGEAAALWLAAGSGITAVFNVLAERAAAGQALKGQLLYWEKQPGRFCFTEELERLQAEHRDFRVRRFCRDSGGSDGYESGRLDAALAETLLSDGAYAEAVVCGGSAFVASARELLAESISAFHAEAFSPPKSVADSGEGEAFFELSLSRSRRTLTVSSRQSLLEALEDAGMSVPSGCRMGICNSCSCQQSGGESQNQLNGASLRGQGALRLCVSRARSDLELNL